VLKPEENPDWTPAAKPWRCRGPEILPSPEKGHKTSDEGSGWVLVDPMGVRWGICGPCARKRGLIW